MVVFHCIFLEILDTIVGVHMAVENDENRSFNPSPGISKPVIKRVVVLSLIFLFVLQAGWGFQLLINPDPVLLNPYEVGGKIHGTTDPYRTRGIQIESDGLGGSWYDDLDDNSGMERVENCSFVDGGVRLEEVFLVDTWYHDDWPNRMEIKVANSGEVDLLGYQINLQVPYLDEMDLNFSDIRFTCYDDFNGIETGIPYWIEDHDSGESANVWINVTNIPARGECSVFMYYGNPNALDESDGDGTFVFFDDFNGVSLDLSKWDNPSPGGTRTYSVGGGDLYFYIYDVWKTGMNCTMKDQLDIDGHLIEARQRMQKGGALRDNNNKGTIGIGIENPWGDHWWRYYGRSKKDDAWLRYSFHYDNTIWKEGSWDGADTDYHILGLGKHDDTVFLYEDSVELTMIQDENITDDRYKTSIVNVVNGYDGGGWGKLWTDWYRIRRQVFPEPTVHLKTVSGVAESFSIDLPESMNWDTLSLMKEENGNSYIRVNIMNPATNKTIAGHGNLEMENVDISGLNFLGVNSIRLQAVFTGIDSIDSVSNLTRSDLPENEIDTPFLYSWGVEWVADNAWRDSFIGDGKLVGDVNISGGQLKLRDDQLLLEAGLVGLWNFDEGAGNTAYDTSGNNNNGTLNNMDNSDWINGRVGTALDFDGNNDYVGCGNDASLSFGTGNFALEVWMKTNTFIPTGNFSGIISKFNRPSHSGPWIQLDENEYIIFGWTDIIPIQGDTKVNDGKWHHIVAQRTGTTSAELYLNGILHKSNVTAPSRSSDSSANLDIGRLIHESRYFDGHIDEVRLYNRALTSEEILQHNSRYYNNPTFRSETITLPEGTGWDTFRAHRSVPENTYLNISIHDAESGKVLVRNTENTNNLFLNLSDINPNEHKTIYLQAYFQSNETETPILYDWGVQATNNSMWPVAVAGKDIAIEPHEIVYFNGSGSYDDKGIVNYSWSFSYGGRIINLFGEKVEFRFDEVGSYLVQLNVSDADGLWGIDELLLTVGDAVPPVSDPGPDMIIDQFTSVLLDGSGSSDNVGIVNFTWSFEYGGGVILLYGENVRFKFSLPGVYVITLRAVDFHENWAENSSTIEVRDIIKPTARAGRDIVVLRGEPIFLNGNGSSDNVGIVNYSWDFLYDGEPIVLDDENTTFVFDISGNYNIRLVVRDGEGNVGIDNLTVFVMEDDEEPEENNEEPEKNETDSDGDGWNDTAEVESGSDPYDNRSTPLDWDGDGVPNERDAYPRDSGRWTKGKEVKRLKIAVYFGLGVIVLLICFIGYTRISKQNIFQNGKREKICSYIQQNPGLHFREISRRMNINSGTLYHHMRKLEDAKMINPISDGYYMRYYYGNQNLKHNSVTPMQEKLLKIIGQNSGITYKQLGQKLNLSYPTISYHVTALSDSGLVMKVKENGLIHLYIAES